MTSLTEPQGTSTEGTILNVTKNRIHTISWCYYHVSAICNGIYLAAHAHDLNSGGE